MSPDDAARLQAVFRRETRGLLQYARGAALYAGQDGELLGRVNRAADEETAALQAFAEFLESRRITPPQPGSFPATFTDLNFVSVRFLLPRLVEEQRRALAALEADRGAIADPAARDAVRELADLHQRHLKELDS